MLVGYFSSLDKTVIVISSLSVENKGKAAGNISSESPPSVAYFSSYTCSPSYVIMWCLIKHKDNITLAVACPHFGPTDLGP